MQVNSASVQQDEYLTLLVSQLRNQDPLEPVSQEDFVGQVAQFSSLAGIEKLNATFEEMLTMQQDVMRLQEMSVGANLVGHDVDYVDAITGGRQHGTVSGIEVNAGRLHLTVSGQSVSLDQVISLE